MDTERLFLDYSVEKLKQYCERIEACFGNLTSDQIWARGHENENSAGNLALHLAGNIRQWIVATLGGELDARNRDGEFAAHGGVDRVQLLERLKANVAEAVTVIESMTIERLQASYRVQNYEVSGLQAVYHVVEHFAMHTGQIIFLTKMLTGADLGFYGHLRSPQHQQRIP